MQDQEAIVIQLDFLEIRSLLGSPLNSNLISHQQPLILVIAGGVMILVDICVVIMMKNYKLAGYNMASLVQLHDFIVREVHSIVRSHGSLRRIPQKS